MIVCAGMPRCGTTLMFGALAGLSLGGATPKDYQGDVTKTHSFRPHRFAEASKAIFMFGDPIASIISTKKNRMTPGHFRNCGAGDLDPATTDIFSQDVLNYEKMFDNWMRRQSFDLICVRYEALYENAHVVASFFDDRYLYLKPKQPRTTATQDVSRRELETIRATYGNLARKVEAAPDVTIYRAAR